MEQSDHMLQRIQEWKTNFEMQGCVDETVELMNGKAKLAEIQRLINVNDVLETYFQEIDRLPEKLRKSSLNEFIATCETIGLIVDKPAGESCVRKKSKNRSRMDQKPNTWANRLRGPRKLVPEPFYALSNKKTPADEIKFRTLRRAEVAFSVAGTPVIAGNETESDESAFLVNELLHARDEELTPLTRNVVRGMKQLIGRIRTSEIPKHL
ncbi:unnamed protein product [Onchocerca flexuosa]|uniref:Uncharacterized protein n=1 Tax=Onchocerca flexuosa TaxID=387005 RepID=A0A183I3J3_9BILA|nr:unnamed protein product [Onchocerca flexuosa]